MGFSQNVTLFYVLRDPHLRFGSYAVEIIITFCVKLLRFGLSSYVLGNVTFCGPTACLVLSSATSCPSSILFRSSFCRFAAIPCHLFLEYGIHVVAPSVQLVVFEAVDVLCLGPPHLSHIADYIYELCPLSDQDVGPSVLICDVEHTHFHLCLCVHQVFDWWVSISLYHMS